MARINVKYPCGKNVVCGGIKGMVTAVYIRGKGRAYEFSYIDNNGDPKSVTTEEYELEPDEGKKLGF